MPTPLPLLGISEHSLKSLDPSDFLDHIDPLLANQARTRFVPGYDEEDLKQEFAIVALRCQRSYDPSKKSGHGGKRSSFMNFVTVAIQHRAVQLAERGNRQTREVRELACLACGQQKGIWQKGDCPCGGRTWRSVWSAPVASLNELTQEHENDDATRRYEPAVFDPDELTQRDLLTRIIGALPAEYRAEFITALDTGKLRKEIRQLLQIRLAALSGRVLSK